MSKLSARIFQHKRKRKIRRLTYPPCTMSHFAFLRQRCAYRLGKGRSMRCSKFKGERGDASRSKRHCYLSISKDSPPTKAEQKIKAQNRTYVYVRFWASLTFFALQSFPFRSFPPIAFCEFGSDESRCEEPPLPPTTDLRRQQSASAATREFPCGQRPVRLGGWARGRQSRWAHMD